MARFRVGLFFIIALLTNQLEASNFKSCCEEILPLTGKRSKLLTALKASFEPNRANWKHESLLKELLKLNPEQESLAYLFVHFKTFDCQELEKNLKKSSDYSFNLINRPHLPEYLREGLKINSLTILRNLNLSHVRTLSLQSQRIGTLEGLTNLTNLEKVNLSGNRLTSSSKIEVLKNAALVDLEANAIEDLSVFRDFKNLRRLNLDYNCVKNLTPIKEIPQKLKTLSLNHNIFSKVDLIRAGDGFTKNFIFSKTKPKPRFKYGLREVHLYSSFNDFLYCPFTRPTQCFFEKPSDHPLYFGHHFDDKPTCLNQLNINKRKNL